MQLQKSSKNGIGGIHFIDPDTRIRKLWDMQKTAKKEINENTYVDKQYSNYGISENTTKKGISENTTKKGINENTYVDKQYDNYGIRKKTTKKGYAKYDKKKDT